MEIWKDIKGYECLYQISSEGRVRSLDRTIIRSNGKSQTFKGRVMKLQEDNGGYVCVLLSNTTKEKKRKMYHIHRLVAEAFIPNNDNKPCIDHINTIRTDNRVENLRWCTHKENNNNPLTKEKKPKEFPQLRGKAHHNSKPIIQYSKEGIFIKEWGSSLQIEREIGICNSSIRSCCKGKQHTAGGYKWKYAA